MQVVRMKAPGAVLGMVAALVGGMVLPVTAVAAAPAAVPSVVVTPKVVTFDMPVWSPLRTPARVSCVRTNCPGPYHNVWAIDFLDTDNSNFDPLFASAPGIVRIGEIPGANSCLPGVTSYGNWIWIDHGAGRSTRYTHLNSVLVKEGQRVTPRTQIGTMGHSGNNFPCRVEYLHMEFRVNNVRVEPPPMFACVGVNRVTLPQHLGYAEWDVVPTNLRLNAIPLKPNIFTPQSTNACMP